MTPSSSHTSIGQTIGSFHRLIQGSKIVFALPFALAGALLPSAAGLASIDLGSMLRLVGAFVFARTAGMAFNGFIDRKFDRANPRTAGRPIPKGELGPYQVVCLACVSLLLFFLVCASISSTVFFLSLGAGALIALYSYTKLWTEWCHVILGGVYFFAPMMAWLTVTGEWHAGALWFGGSLLTLIGGSDIIYALQDVDFDRRYGLHSFPASVGIGISLWVARLFHGLSLVCLGLVGHALGFEGGLGWIYYGGLVVIGTALGCQHICLAAVQSQLFNVSVVFNRSVTKKEQMERRKQIKNHLIMQIFSRCNTQTALGLLAISLGVWGWHVLF